jgi:hypothetical protein
MVDPVETKFRQVIVMGGNVFKLRESPKKFFNMSYLIGYEHIEINFTYLTTKLLEKSNNGSS